jgi:CheY-like chemotaxis protein
MTKARVLLVHENVRSARFIQHLLEEAGHDVEWRPSLTPALLRSGEIPNAVVFDLHFLDQEDQASLRLMCEHLRWKAVPVLVTAAVLPRRPASFSRALARMTSCYVPCVRWMVRNCSFGSTRCSALPNRTNRALAGPCARWATVKATHLTCRHRNIGERRRFSAWCRGNSGPASAIVPANGALRCGIRLCRDGARSLYGCGPFGRRLLRDSALV